MSIITPVRLQILLYCYINSDPFIPTCNYEVESLKWLEEHELIDNKQYITEKASIYVKHLINQPFPIKKWAMSNKGE